VNNSGTISGGSGGVVTTGKVNIVNSGTISGAGFGISASIANINNSGTITGGSAAIGLDLGNVTNSGIIWGETRALQFGSLADTLTLLPGSRIVGTINLFGGGDTVNVLTGNQNLTFDTLAGVTVTSNVPFVVSGNRIVTIDPTPFAMTDRNLLDFARAVSSTVPDIEGSATATTAAADNGSALAFAGPDTNASLDDSLPGLSAYADDSTMPFKSPTVVYGDGTALWARGFVGERVQDADGALLETHNRFYGGLLGGGWQVRPNLRLGLFLGAGETRSQVDFGYGETRSTLVFAGLTGRYNWGASFLRFGLQGGHSSNDTTRSNINNNLVPGGLETATASFDGWYITPEATFGHHFALGSVSGGIYTLTPSLTVRYLHALLDGYTETGTTAPLTVGDRSADSFEERGQLKLIRTQTFAPTEILKTSIFGGVLADQRVGGDTVDAVLLGQAIPFATPGDDSVWGGFGGLGLEWSTGRVTLFASTEYLALSDSSSVISGQGGVRIAF
jgi:outer membrane autotransporter protein